jgi:hypothetical protein
MLAFNGDNATSNDTQTAELEKKKNSFNLSNHIRCFNHTIQLSAKALLKPFSKCVSASTTDDDDDMPALDDIEDEEEDRDGNDDDGGDEDDTLAGEDDEEDGIDEFEALGGEEQAKLLEETAAVKETISKVRNTSLCPLPFPDMSYRFDNSHLQ